MAYIDEIYIHVTSEKINRKVDISEHPVEKGYSIADSVRAKPTTISLTGEIVPFAKSGAFSRYGMIISLLEARQMGGALIRYTGTTILQNAVIDDFSTTASSKIAGGCAFTMTIREIKIAAQAYVASSTGKSKIPSAKPKQKKLGTQQVQKNTTKTYYVVKKGDCLWNIAVKYYGDGSKFTIIRDANKSVISKHGSDPNMIWAGDKLYIPAA